jgi:hypothetical protein
VGALEQAHRRDDREQPRQFVHLRHIALAKENGARGIEPAGEEPGRGVEGVAAQVVGFGDRGERVVIGDEIDGLALALHLDGRLHRAEIIAEMQRAGGLDAGENNLHGIFQHGVLAADLVVVEDDVVAVEPADLQRGVGRNLVHDRFVAHKIERSRFSRFIRHGYMEVFSTQRERQGWRALRPNKTARNR